jgi:hypothetical protein
VKSAIETARELFDAYDNAVGDQQTVAAAILCAGLLPHILDDVEQELERLRADLKQAERAYEECRRCSGSGRSE